MIWTAWNNGAHRRSGAGYGLKIPIENRDVHFVRSHGTVFLEVEGRSGVQEIEFNIDKESFWGPDCHELIKGEFGKWLIDQGLAPWLKGHPPKFRISKIGERRFRLEEVLAA